VRDFIKQVRVIIGADNYTLPEDFKEASAYIIGSLENGEVY